jgi:hypothetical protein
MHAHQTEFSPALFDMLFGLLIFLGMAALFELRDGTHVAFYLASMAIVVHWWLKRKVADATYGLDTRNSTLDLLFGLAQVALLQLAMLAAAEAEYVAAVTYFSLPLIVESAWALLWRFFGSWGRSSRQRVRYAEQQLEYAIFIDLAAAALMGGIIALAPLLAPADLALCFIWAYAIYAVVTHRLELVDVKLL